MPRLAIDWQAIKARLPSVDAPFLVAIPDGGRLALVGMCEMLLWRASYLDGHGYTEDEFDEIRDTIEALTLGLLEGVNMDELFGYIDEIEGKLDVLAECCNPTGGVFQIPSIPPPATVGDITVWPIGNPDTIPPAPADILSPVGGVSATYPTIPDYNSDGTIGETEFFDYRCAGSTFVLDTIINLLRWSAKAKRLIGDISDILSDLAFHIAGHYAAGTPLGNLLTILDMTGAATWPNLLNAATATGLETAASQVEAVKDTIRQELACGATAAGALTILQAALQGTITDAAALAFLSGGGVLGVLVSLMWTAALDTGWAADCSCDTLTTDYITEYFFAGATEHFVGNSVSGCSAAGSTGDTRQLNPNGSSVTDTWGVTPNNLALMEGFSLTGNSRWRVRRVVVAYYVGSIFDGPLTMTVAHGDGTSTVETMPIVAGVNQLAVDFPDKAGTFSGTAAAVTIRADSALGNNAENLVCLDEVAVWWDYPIEP